MCCPNDKHSDGECCELEKARQEEFTKLATELRQMRQSRDRWHEKATEQESTIDVLSAECKRLSEELARFYK